MRWGAFVHQVKERGQCETTRESERADGTVLALLGAHLVGEARADLPTRPPEDLALVLLNPLQACEPTSTEQFYGSPRPGRESRRREPRPGT
jgi:hypothetical protein